MGNIASGLAGHDWSRKPNPNTGGMSPNPDYDPNEVNKPFELGGTTYSVGG